MSNNSSFDCDISPRTIELKNNAYFATYYILTPIYFLIGIIGNGLLLMAFREQSKKDKAYVYQFILIVNKTLEAVTFTLFVIMYKWWSDAESPGVTWFLRNYVLMAYVAYASIPLMNCFTTSTLLISFVMAGDRVLALGLPFKYKYFNHRRIQIVSTVVCLTLGISSNIFDCFRYIVVRTPDSDLYSIGVDEIYVSGLTAKILARIRLVLRIGALIGLIGLNIAMILMFKKRSRKVTQMASATGDSKKEHARKSDEKALLQLTAWQAFLLCVAVIPINCYYLLAYVAPSFTNCWGIVVVPFADMSFVLAESMVFFVIFAVNKKQRTIIVRMIRCAKSNGLMTAAEAHSVSVKPRRGSSMREDG